MWTVELSGGCAGGHCEFWHGGVALGDPFGNNTRFSSPTV
jgi:hypothetical protein